MGEEAAVVGEPVLVQVPRSVSVSVSVTPLGFGERIDQICQALARVLASPHTPSYYVGPAPLPNLHTTRTTLTASQCEAPSAGGRLSRNGRSLWVKMRLRVGIRLRRLELGPRLRVRVRVKVWSQSYREGIGSGLQG